MKGRTWCISFEDTAKKDGDVQIKYIVIDASGVRREIRGTWEGYKAGDPPDKKAKRFFDALNSPPYNALVGVTRAGNTVCFQLKDGAPYQDIIGVEVGDQSGQNSDILTALVDAFNGIYAEMGFPANLDGDEVVVPKVPCKLGTRGGSNDKGLSYWLSMADPHAGPFSRIFDKPGILLDSIRLTNARLDLAGIGQVRFADPDLATFLPVQDGNGGAAAPKRQWAFTVVNTTNQNASDLHVTLAGTGGSLRNPRILFEPDGCAPGLPSTPRPPGNRVDVKWNSACVRPGDTVGILVDTDFVPLDVVSVLWTRDGKPIEDQAGFDGSGEERVVLAVPDGDGAPRGDPSKPGPHGWPTDSNGNEVIPPFTHAEQFFIECWTPQPNRTIGVKGSLCGLFRWDCDLLANHIQLLTAAIRGVWGQNSIPNFRRGNNPGMPALNPPNYPPGFDNGPNLNPFIRVRQFPQVGTRRIVVTIANCDKYFDEQGANYMLLWPVKTWVQNHPLNTRRR